MEAPAYVAQQLKEGEPPVRRGGPRARGQPPAGAVACGAPTCSAPRPRATSTSCATCSAPTARRRAEEAPPDKRPRDVVWADKAAEGRLDLLMTIDFRMTVDDLLRRRPAGCDVVREARPQHHRHASLHPLVQPRHRAAVADEDGLGGVEGDREALLRARGGPPRHPQGRRRQAVVARHPGGDGHDPRGGQGLEDRRGRPGARARRCRCSWSPSATSPRSTRR